MISADGRHPATKQIARWFEYEHLPAGKPRHLSAMCAAMADQMLGELSDGPELTAGLRKLIEAKDCFVRAAIEAGERDNANREIIEGGFKPTTEVMKGMRDLEGNG